mmetsp:Transcript_12544/g.25488  ORF Transcript_12544/g.25488 Transcript_12544/m.25488 type:complete len:632 (-) Transcript_12544:150-2045(-)
MHGSAEVDAPVIGAEIDCTVVAGRGLVAKDRSLFGKKSSDPFVVISCGQRILGTTEVIEKNLSPVWNKQFKLNIDGKAVSRLNSTELVFAIFDKDKLSANDPMGQVRVPLSSLDGGHVSERWHEVNNCSGCSDASGELQIKASMVMRHALCLHRHDTLQITQPTIAVGLGWERLPSGSAIDLDTSCVCVDHKGNVLMGESVYFANLRNPNGSIRHTGDELTGDEDLGSGDDEIIVVDLCKVPSTVRALFFLATVCDDGRSFADVKSARMRLVDCGSGAEMCRYVPATKGAHTALFFARVARGMAGTDWQLSTIGEVDHTARDFGSLVPEIKAYMQDIVPGVQVDMHERIALMRKNGVVRIKDYFGAVGSQPLVFGLAWDVTEGVKIDLDASAILLSTDPAGYKLVDIVYYGKLVSSDGSVRHCGDQRTGEAAGDDEQIVLGLGQVHPAVCAIGIVVNSYSGQELDDVAGCSCHLFDPATGRDLARYALSGVRALDKRTALLMACVHRDPRSGDWAMRIVSQPSMGRTAQHNVGDLIGWLQAHPPQPLPQLAPGGGRMMARTPTESAAMMAAHPSGRLVPREEVVAGQLASASLGAVPVGQAAVSGAVGQLPMGQELPMGTAVLMGQPVGPP